MQKTALDMNIMKRKDKDPFSFLKNLPCSAIATDQKGKILCVNQRFGSILGYPPSRLTNKNILTLVKNKIKFQRVLDELKTKNCDDFYDFFGIRSFGSNAFVGFQVNAGALTWNSKVIFVFILVRYDPTTQWMRCSYVDTLQLPFVLLDEKQRILDFNQAFLEISRYPGLSDSDLRGKNFHALIQQESSLRLKKNIRETIVYLSTLYKKSQNDWRLVHEHLFDSEPFFREQWLMRKTHAVCVQNRRLILRSRHFRLGNNYVIFREPVNVFNMDLRIQYKCFSQTPSDLSGMIGAGVIHKSYSPDWTGYFFGFGAESNTVNVIQRKYLPVAETRKKLPVPGREHLVEIERIGGRWGMRVDGIEILSYLDPSPLLGPGHAHFGLYTYGRDEAMFWDLKIYQKPGDINFEKCRELTRNEIVFIRNPSKIFILKFEPSIYRLYPATLGLFEEVSVLHELDGVGSALERESDMDRIGRAQKHIMENLNKPIHFRDLANLVSMSYTQFFEKFKECYKVSPMGYQVLMKINRAKRMLVSGKYLVREVAYLLGYSDEHSFQRIFKRKTGKTPMEFVQTTS